MSNKLFVGNLSFQTTENDLQDAFAAHGPVLEVAIMVDRMTSRPRGFGFVTMATPEDAQKAIDLLKQLSDSGAYSGSAVAYELGKILEGNKHPDQAKAYYEKIVTQFADSPFRADAEAGLKRMGFNVPTAAPAPPANPS